MDSAASDAHGPASHRTPGLAPEAANLRTSNAIFSMVALMPMHVNGAYRAIPLPLVAVPLRRSAKK